MKLKYQINIQSKLLHLLKYYAGTLHLRISDQNILQQNEKLLYKS